MVRPKSPINPEILKICPVLNKYEKELLKLKIIDDKDLEPIALQFRRRGSTISTQIKKAVEKYDKWCSNEGKRIIDDIIRRGKEEEKSNIKKSFMPDEIEAEGELAAKVFKLIKDNYKPEDIVIKLKMSPKKVNQLYRDFKGIPEKAPIKEYIDIRKRLETIEGEVIILAKNQEEMIGVNNSILHHNKEIGEIQIKLNNLNEKVDSNFEHTYLFDEKCEKCGDHFDIVIRCHNCGANYNFCRISSFNDKRGDSQDEIRYTLSPSS